MKEEGSTRKLSTLGTGLLCPHLKELRPYIALTENMRDELSSEEEIEDNDEVIGEQYLPREKVGLKNRSKSINYKFK